MAICFCRLCNRDRQVGEILATKDVDKITQLLRETYEMLQYAEHDLNWHQAIMDGSWPQAVQILEQALKRAIAQREPVVNSSSNAGSKPDSLPR